MLAWLHDLDSFVIRFAPGIGIRWYGLSYAAAFVLGWLILRWLGRRGATRIPPHLAGDAIMSIVLGVVLGGRLGYILFYDPALLTSFSSQPPFWGALAIHKGGMASHGGIIGVIIAAFFIARRLNRATLAERDSTMPAPGAASSPSSSNPESRIPNAASSSNAPPRISVLHVLDTLALLTPSGLFLGRIANFINGELLGRIVAMPGLPAPWWAVKFPNEVLTDHDPGPLMDPQAAAERLEALDRIAGTSGPNFGIAYERVLDRLRHPLSAADRALADQLAPLISARHPSQLYQAFAEGIVVGAILWLLARRARRPGTIGAAFVLSYGILRILTEHWRLPDGHLITKTILGLTRGQWLSVPLIVVGLVALFLIHRRNDPPVGGWARKPTP